jgi:ABC-type amino acid transport system permease subunit
VTFVNQTSNALSQVNDANSALGTQSSVESIGVSFDELSSRDKWRFAWGFFWRGLCIAALSMLGGAIAGAVIGFVTVIIARILGKSLADVMLLIRILSGTAGLFIGFAFLWQLLRWYFRAKWFGHRLRLVKYVA